MFDLINSTIANTYESTVLTLSGTADTIKTCVEHTPEMWAEGKKHSVKAVAPIIAKYQAARTQRLATKEQAE